MSSAQSVAGLGTSGAEAATERGLQRGFCATGHYRTLGSSAEALDMLGALSCGHDGSLCTVHAGSAAEALRRLETLALMAGVGLPHAAIREQVADAIHLVVCQARMPDGGRAVIEVGEVVRIAGGAAVRTLYHRRDGRCKVAPPTAALASRLALGEAAGGFDVGPGSGA